MDPSITYNHLSPPLQPYALCFKRSTVFKNSTTHSGTKCWNVLSYGGYFTSKSHPQGVRHSYVDGLLSNLSFEFQTQETNRGNHDCFLLKSNVVTIAKHSNAVPQNHYL